VNIFDIHVINTRWFKCDRDYLCANKSHFVPVIFEPPCMMISIMTVFVGNYYSLHLEIDVYRVKKYQMVVFKYV
jgi:hypothetical protein